VTPGRKSAIGAIDTHPAARRAQRSYSIASSPLDRGVVELTIDRLRDGEVTPYFQDVLVKGDDIEHRGPFASFSSGAASRRSCWSPAAPASYR
jgi:ferredoxin-NADP reductase